MLEENLATVIKFVLIFDTWKIFLICKDLDKRRWIKEWTIQRMGKLMSLPIRYVIEIYN